MARRAPSFSVMKVTIAATEPLSSISFPNSAPSRKSGKNWARKLAALPMKVWVQWASSGSLEKDAAISAARGASSSTLHPRKASAIKRPRPSRMPRRPSRIIASALRQQYVDIRGGALADVLAVGREECARALAPLFFQQRHELPLGIELRGGAERRELIALDAVRTHPGPARALTAARIGDLAQQRDHAQLLH